MNQCWAVLNFFGEPPRLVPSYYYFLKVPLGKVLNFKKIQNLQLRSMFFINMGDSWVLGFKFVFKGAGPGNS
jgi:hypothetical protein